jgi:hypothetical protein
MDETQINKTDMKDTWISASQISQVCFCPHSLALKSSGYKPSAHAQHLMRQGIDEHEKLNLRVRTDVQDKRCYVATHLYGTNDWRTQRLRIFRDEHLKSSWWGRSLVSIYYHLSPSWVRVCCRLPWVDRLTRRGIEKILYVLMQKQSSGN